MPTNTELSLSPKLDSSVYDNVVMVPFDDKTITWCIAFIYQDYDKLSSVAKNLYISSSNKWILIKNAPPKHTEGVL